jgi:hypothetical protein
MEAILTCLGLTLGYMILTRTDLIKAIRALLGLLTFGVSISGCAHMTQADHAAWAAAIRAAGNQIANNPYRPTNCTSQVIGGTVYTTCQ